MEVIEQIDEVKKGASSGETQARTIQNIDTKLDLAPMQKAYWIGEFAGIDASCIGFIRCDYSVRNLQPARLERSIKLVCQSHNILRASIEEEGRQIFKNDSGYSFDALSSRDMYQKNINRDIEQRFASDSGLNLIIKLIDLGDSQVISIAAKLSCLDGRSFNRIIDQIFDEYTFGKAPKGSDFSEYIAHVEDRSKSRVYKKSERYWSKNLKLLSKTAKLPAATKPKNASISQFNRISLSFGPEIYSKLVGVCNQHNVNVNSLLFYVYGKVLQTWSETKQFTINMMVSDIDPYDGDLNEIVGNRSSTTLVPFSDDELSGSLLDKVRVCEKDIFSSISHKVVNGIQVTSLIRSNDTSSENILFPYVFNSSLLANDASSEISERQKNWEWKDTYIQTPQVHIDLQVYDYDDSLYIHWDYLSERFDKSTIEEMVHFYKKLLIEVTLLDWEKGLLSDFFSTELDLQRASYNDTARDFTNSTSFNGKKLHSGFLSMVNDFPNKVAIENSVGLITYEELYKRAGSIAAGISSKTEARGVVVSVYLERGIDQIAAILGVLMSGNAYLPIDSRLPKSRVNQILVHSQSNVLLVDSACKYNLDENFEGIVICVEEDDLEFSNSIPHREIIEEDELAYVIYTSGSTGVPKGVEINHAAAINTIDDLIERFKINQLDKLFCVSSTNFDLSVFDIFAALSVGATIVLTDEEDIPDPQKWIALNNQYRPTIWNSVPALFELYVESLGLETEPLNSLRLVMLSGDWLSKKFSDKFARTYSGIELVSLGGATEASIWSNFHRVTGEEGNWKSVPYGRPLGNQQLYVFDKNLISCPDMVVGDLYIGGEGVANGYLNDSELTSKKFIQHAKYGLLYYTGDLARFRDGIIEFIGRRDVQVKIRGFRIELGEIESTAASVTGVTSAVAFVEGDTNETKSLSLAYSGESESLTIGTIRDRLMDSLPSYMVPSKILYLDDLPLTANGKIDRKSVIEFASTVPTVSQEVDVNRTQTQELLYQIWKEMLTTPSISLDDNFFSLGGSSILAIRMATRIKKEMDFTIVPSQVIELTSIRKIAEYIDSRSDQNIVTEVKLNSVEQSEVSKDKPLIVLLPPVSGNIECYKGVPSYASHLEYVGLQIADYSKLDGCIEFSTLAKLYSEKILESYTGRLIYLGGWSMGALLAIEVSRILKDRTDIKRPLLLIDPWVNAGQHVDGNLIEFFFKDLFSYEINSEYLRSPDIQSVNFWKELVASINGRGLISQIDPHELMNLYERYIFNTNLIKSFDFEKGLSNSILFVSKKEDTLRNNGLVPILSSVNSEQVVDVGITELDEDHWSVMEDDSLKNIFKVWVGKHIEQGGLK